MEVFLTRLSFNSKKAFSGEFQGKLYKNFEENLRGNFKKAFKNRFVKANLKRTLQRFIIRYFEESTNELSINDLSKKAPKKTFQNNKAPKKALKGKYDVKAS